MPNEVTDNLSPRGRLVWDLPTRLFHWLFVMLIVGQYVTAQAGGEWMVWHFRMGYCMIGLLVFRILWGIVGPTHARFRNFLKGPGVVLDYMRQVHKRGEQAIHSAGHNPMGGLMVVIMLALVAAQAITGLFSTDDTSTVGPYAAAIDQNLADSITNWHHGLFNVIIGAAVLHILAVLFYTVVKKDRLIPAMIHGRKPVVHVPADEGIEHSALLRALLIVLLAAGAAYAVQYAGSPSIDTSASVSEEED